MKHILYKLGCSALAIRLGDLTTSTADVLVSSDASYMPMDFGVAAAIRSAGGETILIDAAKKSPAGLGDVIVTTAGFLKTKHVFHAITIGAGRLRPMEVIRITTRRCLELLEALGLRSIAFPAIGAGAAGFSYEEVADQMAAAIIPVLMAASHRIDVTIYLYDPMRGPSAFATFCERFATSARKLDGAAPALPPRRAAGDVSSLPERDSESEKRKAVLGDLTELEKERARLEGQLAHYGGIPTKGESRSIAKRLTELQEERIRLLSAVKPASNREAVTVFVSYSHADERLRRRLGKHLAVLERQGLISTWHDRKIPAGMEQQGVIDAHLKEARIILLLLSSDFLSSDYCYDVEVRTALERHERGDAVVIPIILRPAVLDGLPFSKLRPLPENARAATDWPTLDSAFVSITKGLRDAIVRLTTTAV